LKKIGAFAQYAAIEESALSLMPDYLSFEEAASIPLTALTAMQAFEIMQVKSGESIFISGGTGSLGAMAIPIAKSLGLHVYTNGSKENEERVRKLGAERFIDYKKENYVDVLTNVDHVLDTLGDRELPNEFKVLKKGGNLVSLRGLPNGRFAKRNKMSLFKQILFQIAGRKYDKMAAKNKQTYDFIFVHEDGKQLDRINQIFNKTHPIETSIDTIFSLDQINEALNKVRNGKSKGKTIIKIGE
ncbi:NADP-dependent oxidoreductase, partial [Sharpea azabuensis]|uniref:NADP-dependent oxidoreductase n=1 Tax=Sharpea azabuensis TaxID=322505 RepID=UPI002E8050CE